MTKLTPALPLNLGERKIKAERVGAAFRDGLSHCHLPRRHRALAAKGALDGAGVCDIGKTLGLAFAPRRARNPITQIS